MTVNTNIIREVWVDDNPNGCIRVSSSIDLVRFLAPDKYSEQYFGKFDVELPSYVARELGKALIACADECEEKST